MATANDREQGLMEGIAVGNLLGIHWEFCSQEEVRQERPDGVTEIVDVLGKPDDDDLAQAIIIAEEAARGPLDANALGERFWAWAEVNSRGMGGLTGVVLEIYGGAYPKRACLQEGGVVRPATGVPILAASAGALAALPEGKGAGNGALMRCAPLAIRYRDDAAALARESVVSAIPTHWDPKCGWSCVVLNLACAAALRGETLDAETLLAQTVAAVASAGDLSRFEYDVAMQAEVADYVRNASAASLDSLGLSEDNIGYTLLSMGAALTAWWQAPSFEAGLRALVEAGGDTDTNGAIAGALLGAKFGASGIPQRWRDSVAELRAGRRDMVSYADALAAAREGAGG